MAVENWQRLIDALGIEPEHVCDLSPGDRYAAVMFRDFAGDQILYHSIAAYPTLEEAFAHVGDQVLDGLAPDGVYDLETAQKIDVHVSTPIVTASEDQGITINPLDEE